ncbi:MULTISPECIES: non-ribosomal peptide synthetase [unclassified Pseudomonas]|uniref:non-ribosomal peptide synthetase n=1 Tax=unclassified Pseudomonas TaxID=196821 RepID=UPI00244B3649|nr:MULTISPECIES: non-ribosomal peptide synthetase [unclassified Pseudomonas]MDH0303283.1 amino acid adenylation domain-containing protein [Pseudomonas sp. GD04091]MDH1985307.1 amino acid adenylation domain-containing protein [Pseudomonas sp. GD03689]
MSLQDLLHICRERQIELWTREGKLHFRAPQGALDPTLAERIRAQREALMAHLTPGSQWRSHPEQALQPFALSAVQGAYVLGRNPAFDYGGNACHLYVEYPWPANIDTAQLEQAWNAVVQRHPMLRAVVQDNSRQCVQPQVPWQALPVHDLRQATPEAFVAHLQQVRERLDHACHALDQWPILLPEISLGAEGAVLHCSVDFTLIDYASLQLLLVELNQRYLEPTRHWPALEATFRDYLLHEQQARESAAWHDDKAWWLARLDNLPGRPDLPLSDDAGIASTRFEHHHGVLSPTQWNALCALASAQGLSAAGVTLAAFAEVIGRWSQSPDFCLNLTVLNRPDLHPQLGQVLGDFTALSLLEVRGASGATFVQRARRIGAQLFEDLDHGRFTGVEVLRELARLQGRGADLMPVVFTSGIGSVERLLGDSAHLLQPPSYMISQTPQVWIDCQVSDQYGGLQVGWDVRRGVLPAGMAARMFDAYIDLLRRLAEEAQLWQARGDIVLPRQCAPQLTARQAEDRNIASGVARQALRTPDAQVISDRDGRYSYRQVFQHAEAVRMALEALGVAPGARVGVMLPKSAWQLMAVLGINQLGAAYVPIDIRQPLLRRETLLWDAGIAAVVTLQGEDLPVGMELPRVAIDSLAAATHWPPREPVAVRAGDLAYIIYTSGSTGTPKGVMLSHGAVVNTLDDINRRYAVGPGDRVLGLAELSFDLSVYDFFGATAVGAQVVLPDPERGADPSHWAQLMREHQVTLWNSVPAQGQMLIDYLETEPDAIPAPRCVMWSGDWIPTTLPTRWWQRWPESRLYSLGGATEAAIWSVEHVIRPDDTALPSIPYGHALDGQTLEVLDSLGRQCPLGVRGEIHIGGLGLALGYAEDPRRTAERFITHASGRRLYRTGDLGRYLDEHGLIEFLGRQDDQVKIRGHRIELAEIDAGWLAHPQIATSTTVLVGERHERSLCSFVTLHGSPRDAQCVQDELTQVLAPARQTLEQADFGPRERIEAALAALDRAADISLLCWLAGSGLLRAGQEVTFAALCQALELETGQQRLLHHWLTLLTDSGYLQRRDAGWRCLVDPGEFDQDQAWARFAELAPARLWPAELVDYLRGSALRLAEQLDGRLSPASLMFPQGSAHIAEAMYSGGLHAQALHQAMAEAVTAIVGREGQRSWRILEVGAGTGAASASIIPALATLVAAGVQVDYLFSDVSSYFLNAARERFAEYPWVRFMHFDMNKPACEQGLPAGSLDLVLSSGALNNALDTPGLLAGLRQLVQADAWLVIQELTREHREISISQSLMMETPHDLRAANGQLFVHRQQWLDWLGAEGGDHAQALASPQSVLSLLGYDLLVARMKTDRPLLSAHALLTFIAERVPRYMVPAQVRVLDRLPVTANGKVDRRALTTQAQQRQLEPVRQVHGEVGDELVLRLIGHWERVLDCSGLAPEQDFFAAGGDSLLIAQLIAGLREHEPLAREQPFDRLLRWALSRPTPAGLAQRLRSAAGSETPVPERPAVAVLETTRAPLRGRLRADALSELSPGEGTARVLVHEGLGTLLPYRGLMTELAGKGPLLGLAVHDSEDYLRLPAQHLNATLGKRYAQALWDSGRRRFDLLGYCSGGLVTLELAKALLQLGAEVRQVDIVSSYRIPYRVDDELLILHSFAATLGLDPQALGLPSDEQLQAALAARLLVSPEHLAAGSLAQALAQFDVAQLKARVLSAASGIADEQLYRVFAHSVQASHYSHSAPYVGAVRLFVPSVGNPLIAEHQASLRAWWQAASLAPLTVQTLQGNHFDCLNAGLGRHLLEEHRP